jgi:hypothetical protein
MRDGLMKCDSTHSEAHISIFARQHLSLPVLTLLPVVAASNERSTSIADIILCQFASETAPSHINHSSSLA